MRIVHVFHNYYPVVGGMERVVQGLAESQAMLGHEVYVITSNYGAKNRPVEETLNGVNVKRINSWRFHYPDLTFPRTIPIELLKKANIVHVHGHNSFFSLKLLDIASKLDIKSVCYLMAVDAFRDHPNLIMRLFASYYGKRNTYTALAKSTLAIVKSFRDFELLKNVYAADITYLSDAVGDSMLFYKKENTDDFRKRFNIKQEKFFLFIGRIHKLKGPHILVTALKYVNKDVAAVFIGPDDGYLNNTLDLAKKLGVIDRTYFLGYVDERTKIAAIDSAVAVVNPSVADRVEVYSIAISEAWAREKPVITSRVGELAYRVTQRVNGILINPSNPQLLANAMLELVSNNQLANEMGKNGKKSVFCWEKIAVRSIDLYKRVLSTVVN